MRASLRVCIMYIPTHIFRSITVVCGYRHTFSVSNDANMNGEKNRLKKTRRYKCFSSIFSFFFPGNTVMYTRRSEKRTKRSRETKSLTYRSTCISHTTARALYVPTMRIGRFRYGAQTRTLRELANKDNDDILLLQCRDRGRQRQLIIIIIFFFRQIEITGRRKRREQ